MASVARSIPASPPELRFKRSFDFGIARFVADEGLLLVLDVTGTLHGLDPEGELLFSRELSHASKHHEKHSGVGAPAFAADGTILVPIVSADASLSIHALARDGSSLSVTRVGPAQPPSAPTGFDGMVLPLRILEGGLWLSYWSRDTSAGEEWLAVRRPDGVVWEASESLFGAIEGVITTTTRTADDRGILLRAREPHDGKVRWSTQINASGSSLNAELLVGGGLLLVDRTRDGTAKLVALDPRDGTPRWTRELEGDVISILTAPHLHAVIVASKAGVGSLVRIARDSGAVLATSTLTPAVDAPRWPPSTDEWPRAIAADHTHLLRSSGRELVCERVTDSDTIIWRLALPVVDLAYGLDVSESPAVPATSMTIAAGRILIRGPNDLQVFS